MPDISVCYFGRFDICFVVDKIRTPSPWTTPMYYPKMDQLCRWSLVIRVMKLSESGSIKGNYNTEKTNLKLDSLCFLTLITKF